MLLTKHSSNNDIIGIDNDCISLLRGKAPSFREKVVIFREQLLHAIEITSE